MAKNPRAKNKHALPVDIKLIKNSYKLKASDIMVYIFSFISPKPYDWFFFFIVCPRTWSLSAWGIPDWGPALSPSVPYCWDLRVVTMAPWCREAPASHVVMRQIVKKIPALPAPALNRFPMMNKNVLFWKQVRLDMYTERAVLIPISFDCYLNKEKISKELRTLQITESL